MPYLYSEAIAFHPLVQFLYVFMLVFLAVFIVLSPAPTVWLLLLVGLLLAAIPALFGRLVIDVDAENLTVRWGYLGWLTKIIPVQAIEKTEVVSYRPFRQFGGWGIRCGRFQGAWTVCHTLRGNRGILLSLSTEIKFFFIPTRRVLLGSQEPDRLQQALGR
ncbi:MAG: hypothetical protein AB1714_10635 [Acidobacteriota bacterium]